MIIQNIPNLFFSKTRGRNARKVPFFCPDANCFASAGLWLLRRTSVHRYGTCSLHQSLLGASEASRKTIHSLHTEIPFSSHSRHASRHAAESNYSVLKRVPHALHARACRKGALALILILALPHLCNGVDKARYETDEDGAAAGERGRRVEEDEARKGDRELVEGADHGVSGGRGDTHAPGGAV